MKLPLLIAWRYLRRPTDRLVSAVGVVSILGLVIGVMALVISMALMTGYRTDLQRKLLGGNAELFLYAMDGTIEDLDGVLRTLLSTEGIAEAWPVVFQHGLVASEARSTGEQVMLKGIEPGRGNSSPMMQKVIGQKRTFETDDGSSGIAVGKHLARRLEIAPGDVVTITVPTQEQSGSFLPRSASFTVTNVYDTGFHEFDAKWIFLDIREAREMLQMEATANLIEVETVAGADLEQVSRLAGRATGNRYALTTWKEMNQQLFSLLEIQQLVLFIVLGLIVFVSTFNIVSTLIMTVHEKRMEIGILSSMGATPRFLRRIFIWYGTLVGVAGTAIGLGLGVLACWILTRFEIISFGPEIAEVYFVSSIPFIPRAEDLVLITAFAILVSFLASLLPSLRATRLNPIEALRWE